MVTKKIIFNGMVVGSYESTADNRKDAEIVHNYLKEKGFVRELTLNDQMFAQANSFANVANQIYKSDLKVSPYKGGSVCPFVVNAAFSIELYLKTIHHAYGNKIRGHELSLLFKNMPNKGKIHFLNAAKEVRHLYKLPENSDINSCLDSLNYAFEHWRYIYENNGIETELQSIRYTLQVSFEACCRAREEIA